LSRSRPASAEPAPDERASWRESRRARRRLARPGNAAVPLPPVLTFGGLRFGEAAALRRSDVLDGGDRLRIERAVRYYDGRWVVGEPKTDAGHRTVALPTSVRIALVRHMNRYEPDTPDALVFGTRSGTFPSAANVGKTFRRAADAVGLGPVRPHELRHTGATLAAAAGASTKELMHRLGHASPDTALIYQHADDGRDTEIARALEARIKPAVSLPLRHPAPAAVQSRRRSNAS
jgi:integrase